MKRRPVHPKARRAVLLVAIVSALIAAASVFPARASAVTCGVTCEPSGSGGVVCGPNGYPYCTWAYTPFREPIENQLSPYVTYGGLGNYDGVTRQVCITIRLLISDQWGGNNQIVGDKSFCYAGANGTGTGTSTNVWGNVYRCCSYLYWYHTWAHSWQVWADGHAHNDRYVASGRVLL